MLTHGAGPLYESPASAPRVDAANYRFLQFFRILRKHGDHLTRNEDSRLPVRFRAAGHARKSAETP
jgi:hypothetical protein